jgi:hypothetical protein
LKAVGAEIGYRAIVVDKADHPQVFDASAFVVALGKDDDFRCVGVPGQFQLVIGSRKPEDPFDDVLPLEHRGVGFVCLGDGVFKLVECEVIGQPLHDGLDGPRVEADVAQLSLEKPLFVKLVGRKSAAAEGLSGRVEADRVVGLDHPRAKNDRGDVSFAGRPQTHQDPNGSVRDA